MEYRASSDIDASAERVWSILTDASRYPEWEPNVVRIDGKIAPGEKITSAGLGGSELTLGGTSMAAPHVSGAAAMLMARFPELIGQPRRIKEILCDSATDLKRERYFQGAGLVDVLRAMQSI